MSNEEHSFPLNTRPSKTGKSANLYRLSSSLLLSGLLISFLFSVTPRICLSCVSEKNPPVPNPIDPVWTREGMRAVEEEECV